MPFWSGAKFTDPAPFTTTVPVKPAGAIVGVMIEPFVMPLTSEGFPRMENVDALGVTVIENDTVFPFHEAVRGTV